MGQSKSRANTQMMNAPEPARREGSDEALEVEKAESSLRIQTEPDAGPRDARLSRAVRSIVCLAREFEQQCRSVDVSLPQYRLLLFLRHGPERAGELAAKVAIKRPTLTALVAGLERDGHLRRVADESDGRGVRIELTATGLAALERVEATLSNTIDRLSAAGDRQLILDAFDQMADIVDNEVTRRHRSKVGAKR